MIQVNTSNVVQANLTGGPFTQAFTPSGPGSIIHVYVIQDDFPTDCAVSDSVNGAYTQLDQITEALTNGFLCTQAYFPNASASTVTITLTMTGGTPNAVYLTILEITGASAAPLDGHTAQLQSSPGTGTNAVTSGNVTSAKQPALVLGAAELSGFSDASISPGTGFTQPVANQFYLCIESLRVTSAGTQAATFTTTAGTTASVNFVVVYDELGSGGGGTAPIPVTPPHVGFMQLI